MATVHRQKLHVVVSCVLSSHARGKILSAREAMFPVPSKPLLLAVRMGGAARGMLVGIAEVPRGGAIGLKPAGGWQAPHRRADRQGASARASTRASMRHSASQAPPKTMWAPFPWNAAAAAAGSKRQLLKWRLLKRRLLKRRLLKRRLLKRRLLKRLLLIRLLLIRLLLIRLLLIRLLLIRLLLIRLLLIRLLLKRLLLKRLLHLVRHRRIHLLLLLHASHNVEIVIMHAARLGRADGMHGRRRRVLRQSHQVFARAAQVE